jgi:hypothetical protein
LGPLAQAYANAEVYDAVQMAMHTDDGLNALLACLARRSNDPRYQEEMAFWCDKMPRETRLFLVQALCASDHPTARAAIAARAADPNPTVRVAALRSLHARPNVGAGEVMDPAEATDEPLPDATETISVDQAA